MSPAPRSTRTRRKEPELFLNRELSWLAFDARVLEEAADATNPLLERLKFAIITSTNLDEFFMVRVAALKHAVLEGDAAPDPAGLTPAQQLAQISARAHEMVARLNATLTDDLLPALAAEGIRLIPLGEMEAAPRASITRIFREEVLPALTPLAIDSSRPFPILSSLSLNLALLLAPAPETDQPRLAVVQVPARLPRLIRPPGGAQTVYTLLEEVIRAELADLFPGQQVLNSAVFRIVRDAELDFDEEGGGDLLEEVEEELKKRRRNRAVRLEVEAGVDAALLGVLSERLQVAGEDVYPVKGPLDVRALMPLTELPTLAHLRDTPLKPLPVVEARRMEDLFAALDDKDIVLHHPYESYDPVVAFIDRAADDSSVLAIKQTLYRTGSDSPIVAALSRAAEAGKQVTVLVELTARFDEQSNIRWARSLEQAGAHVIYGIRGYKTHAKICLVVRRGRHGIVRYVHLGTGNYNHKTARLYTDFSLMTADPVIGEDASAFFNALTGYSDPPRMKKLAMAPTMLRERLLSLIERERRRAEAGQPAEIKAKMNSLVDEEMIRALYDASKAGVRIRLNVRGVCCLRPGLKGVSETIDVVSVVDRFLEHARIFHFRNGGDEELYLASADWMPRNLDRRIELLFPVQDKEGDQHVREALDAMFLDNVKSRWLQADGSYKRRKPAKGDEPYRAQIVLYREAEKRLARARALSGVTLEPLQGPTPER